MLAKLPSMVAPKDDDGVLAQTEAVELVEHLADLGACHGTDHEGGSL